MTRVVHVFSIFLIFVVLLSACAAEPQEQKAEARQGVLDLRSWDFDAEGVALLQGEWLFYPNMLLEPGQETTAEEAITASIPGSWNDYPKEHGFSDGSGYGTYRLTVLTNYDQPTFTIRVPNIFTASKVFVNGEALASIGRPGRNSAEEMPKQVPQLITFVNDSGVIELLVQVSNHHHRKGGIWVDLQLGPTMLLTDYQMKRIAQTMLLAGSLVIIGLYHIGLFAFRREEKFTLYFGLLCLFVSLRASVTGETVLLRWYPYISWEAALKLEYICLTLGVLTGYMYVKSLFPADTYRWVRQVVLGGGLILCLYAVLFPSIMFSRSILLFQFYLLAVSVYLLVVLVIALLRGRPGARYVSLGVGVFLLTIYNDVFYYHEWGNTTELIPFGLFFFILMQAFIISSRFSEALRRVEIVSDELKELNVHLEDRIEERTDALRLSKEKLELSHRELERMERSRRHLLSNISHDLRTPITLIQGYLEAIHDGVVEGRDQQRKYIKLMLNKVYGLNGLIKDLFELSKLESGQVSLRLRPIKAGDYGQTIEEAFGLDALSKGMTVKVSFAEPFVSEAIVQMDEERMNQATANLVYNALKYMEAGGELRIHFSLDIESEKILIDFTDTGIGIGAEDMPFIFDRFYKKDKSRNSAGGGSGIGLAIVKEIIELHGGGISVSSKEGAGTTFRVSLPCKRVQK